MRSLKKLQKKKKSIILITLLLLVFSCKLSFGQWKSEQGIYGFENEVNCLAVSGQNLFAGTNYRGLEISKDNGMTWASCNNGYLSGYNMQIVSLAVNSINGNIYASTYNCEIFLSTDNGNSWNALTGTGLPTYNVIGDYYTVLTNGANIYAYDKVWVSSNNGDGGYYKCDGIYLSTDNGSSWNAINNGLTNENVESLAFAGSNIYAGTTGGVFLSTNNGSSWVNSGLLNNNIISLASSGSNIFAVAAQTGNTALLFLSTDNGSSWTLVSNNLVDLLYVNWNGYFVDNEILLVYTYGSNVYVCSGNAYGGPAEIFVSSNNGASWTNISDGLNLEGSLEQVTALAVSGCNIIAGNNANGISIRPLSQVFSACINPESSASICTGGSVVLDANNLAGLTYQWQNSYGIIPGAQGASYTATSADNYEVNITNNCVNLTSQPIAITVLTTAPDATITAISGLTFCQGGSVELDANTGTGLTYQWLYNGSSLLGAKSQTYTATFSADYQVIVSNGCLSATSQPTTIAVNPSPKAYYVTGGGCPGSDIQLSGSDLGVSYTLYLDGLSTTTVLTGTGNSIDFRNLVASGNYSVVATDGIGCINSMNWTAEIYPYNLNVYNVTGGYTCDGSSIDVGLDGSDNNASYELLKDGIENMGYLSGTGNALYFGQKTLTGNYTIIAYENGYGCQLPMTGSAGISPGTPAGYNVISNGGCPGSDIQLEWSDLGVNYTLYFNGAPSNTVLQGTSISGIDFGNQTATGNYTIVGTDINKCQTTMNKIVTIGIPAQYTLSGGGCVGTDIQLSGSDQNIEYMLYLNGNNTFWGFYGNGGILDFGNINLGPGTITVVAIDANGCTNVMNGSAAETGPNLYKVTGGGCSPAVVGLANSDIGMSYYLYYQDLSNSFHYLTNKAGTGGAIDFGSQSLVGTYSIYSVDVNTNCGGWMVGTVTINALPTSTITGGTSTVTITLTGKQPWILTYAIDGVNQPPVTVQSSPYVIANAAAGTYSVKSLTDNNGCNGTALGQPTIVTYVAGYLVRTGSISSTLCAGGSVNVPYTTPYFTFFASNSFTAQLSDATGSFSSPVTIGTVTNTISGGTISATIPSNTPAGKGYRIRVISSSPPRTASDNGSNIVINQIPTASVSGGGASPDVSIAMTGSAPWSLTYAINGIDQLQVTGIQSSPYNIKGAEAGIYTVKALNGANCQGTSFTGSANVTTNSGQSTITVSGRNIIGVCGDKIILRGVNYAPFNWGNAQSYSAESFSEIAETGANCVRIVWYSSTNYSNKYAPDYNDISYLDTAIARCIRNKMIPIIELHDNSCQDVSQLITLSNWYIKTNVKTMINKYAHNLIINIANESGKVQWTNNPSVSLASFKTTYKTIINNLRSAGINVPLMIDSPDCGEDLNDLVSIGSDLQTSDIKHNLIFSAHAYWYGYAGNDSLTMRNKVTSALTKGVPIVFGEVANWQDDLDSQGKPILCAYVDNYKPFLKICQELNISWLAWSWDNDGCKARQMSNNSTISELSTFGNDIVYNAIYGLKNHSKLTSYLAHNQSCLGTLPTASVTGGGSVCAGDAIPDINIALTGTAPWTLTYAWNGGNQTPVKGILTSPYKITGALAGTYTVTALSDAINPGVTFAGNALIRVNSIPNALITPENSTTFCASESVALDANYDPSYSYQWQRNNMNIIGATNSTYTASLAGGYRVMITNNNGCNKLSNTVNVTVNASPSAMVTPAGPTSVCPGNPLQLTVNNGLLTNKYQWENNGVNVNGATSSQYRVQSTKLSDAGTYTVVVTNKTTGCTNTSNHVIVNINSLSSSVITTSGSPTFCSGGSILLKIDNGQVKNNLYQWYKNGGIITGKTNSSYTTSQSGDYTVKVTNSGCSLFTHSLTVKVNPLPIAKVTPAGPLSVSKGGNLQLTANNTSGYSFQWKKGGVNINGATSSKFKIQNLKLSDAGSYTVLVTNSNGCSAVSNGVILGIAVSRLENSSLSSENNTQYEMISITNYPNPFSSETNIVYSLPEAGIVILKVFDIMGREVAKLVNSEQQDEGKYVATFNGEALPQGIYIYRLVLRTKDSEFIKTEKMILNH